MHMFSLTTKQVWGPAANVFDPGRHLDENGHLIRPTAPNFNGFGAGPRYWYAVRMSPQSQHVYERNLSPAAQLVAYEFVTCMAGIVPYFDVTLLDHDPATGARIEPPKMAEAFTPAMAGPLMIQVQARLEIDDV